MTRRLAASLALLVFAICLIAGIEAGNTVATVLGRSLVAMFGTLVVAFIVGAMAQRMIDENLSQKEAALKAAREVPAVAEPPGGNGTGSRPHPR